jgi:hypothetical protein
VCIEEEEEGGKRNDPPLVHLSKEVDKKLLDFRDLLTSPPIIVGGGWFGAPLHWPFVTCTHKVGRTVQNWTIDYNMGKRMFEQVKKKRRK